MTNSANRLLAHPNSGLVNTSALSLLKLSCIMKVPAVVLSSISRQAWTSCLEVEVRPWTRMLMGHTMSGPTCTPPMPFPTLPSKKYLLVVLCNRRRLVAKYTGSSFSMTPRYGRDKREGMLASSMKIWPPQPSTSYARQVSSPSRMRPCWLTPSWICWAIMFMAWAREVMAIHLLGSLWSWHWVETQLSSRVASWARWCLRSRLEGMENQQVLASSLGRKLLLIIPVRRAGSPMPHWRVSLDTQVWRLKVQVVVATSKSALFFWMSSQVPRCYLSSSAMILLRESVSTSEKSSVRCRYQHRSLRWWATLSSSNFLSQRRSSLVLSWSLPSTIQPDMSYELEQWSCPLLKALAQKSMSRHFLCLLTRYLISSCICSPPMNLRYGCTWLVLSLSHMALMSPVMMNVSSSSGEKSMVCCSVQRKVFLIVWFRRMSVIRGSRPCRYSSTSGESTGWGVPTLDLLATTLPLFFLECSLDITTFTQELSTKPRASTVAKAILQIDIICLYIGAYLWEQRDQRRDRENQRFLEGSRTKRILQLTGSSGREQEQCLRKQVRMTFCSIIDIFSPMQDLGPREKGAKAVGDRWLVLPSSHLSGMKRIGSGKCLSLSRSDMKTKSTIVPLLIVSPSRSRSPGYSLSLGNILEAGLLKRRVSLMTASRQGMFCSVSQVISPTESTSARSFFFTSGSLSTSQRVLCTMWLVVSVPATKKIISSSTSPGMFSPISLNWALFFCMNSFLEAGLLGSSREEMTLVRWSPILYLTSSRRALSSLSSWKKPWATRSMPRKQVEMQSTFWNCLAMISWRSRQGWTPQGDSRPSWSMPKKREKMILPEMVLRGSISSTGPSPRGDRVSSVRSSMSATLLFTLSKPKRGWNSRLLFFHWAPSPNRMFLSVKDFWNSLMLASLFRNRLWC